MAETMKSLIDENDQEIYCSLRLSRLSRLSIEASDGCEADGEMSDEEEEDKNTSTTTATIKYSSMLGDLFALDASTEYTVSLPGTPEKMMKRSGEGMKKYVSDAEAPRIRRKRGWGRRARERRLDEAWEMKKKNIQENYEYCRVLVKPNESKTTISMDIDEVKACRELGIDLPSDWTVEISSGGNSPVAISSPGSDPKEVKARLKVWAQAVALASASSLSP